ncbi:MAG: SDR family NAD(P)-dependent oxidoreductase, partial [Dietzia cercidiphylli]
MGRFDGKSVIVTGAAGGIGEEYAKALAAEGAKVVVADV